MAGPGLAGLITQASAAVTGLLADAVSFLVSAACLLGIRAREGGDERREAGAPVTYGASGIAGPPGTARLRREIGEGLRFVGRDPYLRVLTVAGAVTNLALTGYQTILVVFLVRVVHVAPGAVGYLVAAGSAGGMLGAFAATRLSRRFGTARALVLCQLCTAPFALLTPLAAQGWRLSLVVLGGSVVTAGVVAGNVIRGGFRQAYVPSHLLGRVVVSMQFLNFGAIPAGALAAGALGDTLGAGPTMWLTAGGVALAGLLLLIGPLHRQTDLPARPAGRDDEHTF
nr:MFS transporter [Microbispora sp. GKU 823]